MKLQTRIVLVAVPLAAAFAAVSAVVTREATEVLMVEELGNRLKNQVQGLAQELAADAAAGRADRVVAQLHSIRAFTGAISAEVLDLEGRIAATTDPFELGRVPESQAAARALAADAPVYEPVMKAEGPVLMLASPMWLPPSAASADARPGKRVGTLRVTLPLEHTLSSARRIGASVGAMSTAFCLLGLALTLWLLRVLLRPVRLMADATARVAAGDYAVRIPEDGGDELGRLAGAFNRMAETLSRTTVSRDRLEEALSIARSTLDASADGILVVAAGGGVVTYNRRFLEMWELSDELMKTRRTPELMQLVKARLEDPEGFVRGGAHRMQDLEVEEARDMLRFKDGRMIERISRPYRSAGRAVGRVITFRDLTLLQEGMRALAQARDEAIEAGRVRSLFLANVSHELRTPLNAVIGAAGLLSVSRLDPRQREYADTLGRAAQSLLGLVDDVLDFSKIEAGRMTLAPAKLTPGAIIEEAVSLVAPRASDKGLAMRVNPGEAANWELVGDPRRLRQVLLNLLANAVKFTERGEIEASARVLGASDAQVELEFAVRDTGIGIREPAARQLFAPFMQADAPRSGSGTGLGLAISKSLVELMGGAIGFESRPGEGSRFWFRLTMARADFSPSDPALSCPLPPPEGTRERQRVLVVEDNATNRRLLVQQLERLGRPASSASDGREALEALKAQDFALVLMDCQMPGLDGIAAAEQIRRAESGKRHVPIVAISANAADEDRRRCLAAGMDDFLAKPVTLDALSAALERWDLPFDESALRGFISVAASSPDEARRLLEEFAEDAQARLMEIRGHRAQGSSEPAARSAHSLKGACAAVGARGLKELARRLESAMKDGTPADALLAEAEGELARVRRAIADWKG